MTAFEHQESNIILVKLKLVLYKYLSLQIHFLFHNMPCMPHTTPAVLDKMCVYEKYLYQSI